MHQPIVAKLERVVYNVTCHCGYVMSATSKKHLYEATLAHFAFSTMCHPDYKVS